MDHFNINNPIPFLFSILYFTLASCNSGSESITVSGELLGSNPGQKFVVEKILVDRTIITDTVALDSTGHYEFRLPANNAPILYRLQVKSWLTASFVADNQDLVINFSTDTRTGTFQIEGGSDYTQTFRNEIFKVQRRYFFKQQQAVKKQKRAGEKYGKNSPEHKQAKQSYNDTISEVRDQIAKDLKKEVTELTEKESLLAPVAFASAYQVRDNENFGFAKKMAQQYKRFAPNNSYTKGINSEVNKILAVAVGKPAPNIDLPNPEHKKISLRSLRGQWVLLDFWASWCAPCRKENPALIRLYKKYQDEKFEIYSVSLDSDKKRWVKAIEEDNLSWIHVSDLSKWNSVAADRYAVKAIPALFLISPDGIIEAKRLSVVELQDTLKQKFSN